MRRIRNKAFTRDAYGGSLFELQGQTSESAQLGVALTDGTLRSLFWFPERRLIDIGTGTPPKATFAVA